MSNIYSVRKVNDNFIRIWYDAVIKCTVNKSMSYFFEYQLVPNNSVFLNVIITSRTVFL